MGVLHIYVLPRPGVDDDLLALAHACRPALLEHPIDPASPPQLGDPGTLHITVEMVADVASADIGADERQDLIRALRKELATAAPFGTQVGPPIANSAGAVLDVWPDDEAVALQERVRSAIRSTRGETALQHQTGRPHMSLGYAYDSGDSDELNSTLRNTITPRRAPLQVDAVHLLDVRYDTAPDTGGWRMTWKSLAELPLTG
ncbi:2'-5' RNA ligase family protein [Streptomyces sp. NPDC006670]|uniref:2'-5' RNA ligase family protein n=1 Tax=Streptomyces sp. NPDC006670 TaxID=3154476 RepID=UPI003401C891